VKNDLNSIQGEDTFAGRLASILRKYNMRPSQFAREVEISHPYLIDLLFKGAEPGPDVQRRIVERFPEYTLDWLMRGKKDVETPTPPPAGPTPPAPAPTTFDTTALEQLIEYRTEARIYKKLYEDQMARLDTTLTNIERAMTEHHEETTTDADAEATRRQRQTETKPRKFGFSKAKNGDPIYTRGRKVVKEPH